ncbi:MAG: hypothetical protein AMJ79_04825 [Phycisphaerae bacterium SM23_30]|nr:MAG: hypothetical protein AMJ79_04825 [Phycisphaerae bacterium SM23_30]
MPDKRKHRGAHPEDELLFAPSQWENLRRAARDYSWLLSRGYADKSALKLVGDRFSLRQRQRTAVMRSACADEAQEARAAKQLGPEQMRGRSLLLDGYNVITTVEAALAGGVILLGRDGCYRDIASIHGTYRKVAETIPALKLIGNYLDDRKTGAGLWYLDRPVSNSGRLKKMILETANEEGWDWQVELVYSPDGVLVRSEEAVATSDSEILNRCKCWFNLARQVIERLAVEANIVDLNFD